MEKHEIKAKIEKELSEFSGNFVVNVLIDQHIYHQVPILLLEYWLKDPKVHGLYISLNMPYEAIYGKLKESNLDVNSVYCIDGASKETGKFSNSERCFCLDDPSSLTELQLLIKSLCNENKIRFIVLNSLSTLLLYNNTEDVEKFAHSLLSNARKSDISVAILSPKEQSKEDVAAEITQFCDKEIEL